jgi:hypothetical protein
LHIPLHAAFAALSAVFCAFAIICRAGIWIYRVLPWRSINIPFSPISNLTVPFSVFAHSESSLDE